MCSLILAVPVMLMPLPGMAQYAWDLLKESRFRRAYHAALGPKLAEKWLAQLPGPGEPATRELVDGTEYTIVNSCRPHSCSTHNAVLAYVRSSGKVFGKVVEEDRTTWLGNPPTSMVTLLETAYDKRFHR